MHINEKLLKYCNMDACQTFCFSWTESKKCDNSVVLLDKLAKTFIAIFD